MGFSVTRRDVQDLRGETLYLRRWSIWLPWSWSIKVHWIVRSDGDRCEHDHPWDFTRIILWGGYVEVRDGQEFILKPWRPWAPWRIYHCSGPFKHRIDRLHGSSSLTVALCSPKKRSWGFYTRDGWKPWREFIDSTDRVQWCDDGRQV